MAGETALATLLRSMSPHLNEGDYVFCTLPDHQIPAGCEVIGSFREQEGLTLIVERQQAQQAGLAFDYVAAWITLNVHSALAAVVEQAGFERAAQVLGLSQSAISQRIKLLEARVGQPVLVRATPPTPTDIGRRLLNHVQQVRLLESNLLSNISFSNERSAILVFLIQPAP